MSKVFFSASVYFLPENFSLYNDIIKTIKKTGNELTVNWLEGWQRKYSKSSSKKSLNKEIDAEYFFSSTEKILKSDFVIAEVDNPTIGVGYQIFFASLHKKPVLALYTKAADIKNIKKLIDTDYNLLFLKKYDKKNLFYLINDFLNKREILKKFNFIASDKIIKYLDWVAERRRSKSHSDVLRSLITDNLIDNDAEYQKYLRKIN